MLDGDSSWSITASTRPAIARVYDKEDISCAASNFVIFVLILSSSSPHFNPARVPLPSSEGGFEAPEGHPQGLTHPCDLFLLQLIHEDLNDSDPLGVVVQGGP